jgi:hypothetical protein
MSRRERSESSDALVLRTAAVWGTFVLASRVLRTGQSLVMGDGDDALYAKPDASEGADLPIRAVGSGWELDARGVTGGLLHLRGRREDPSELARSGAPIPIVPGDYGLLMYGRLSLFFQFAHTAPAPKTRVRIDLPILLAFVFAVLTIGGSLLLLYMLYPHKELDRPIELVSREELEVKFKFTPPPPEPEPAPGAEAEGAAGAKAKTPDKAAGSPKKAPGPKRPSPEPPSPGAGAPGASSAMTEVLHGAVGKEVLDTLGTISSVSEALGGLEAAGLVLGGGSGGVGLRASGDGGGQGGTALFGSGTLDTGFGSGAGVAGNGRGRKGSGTGTGSAGSGSGGERRLAAASVSAPGQGLTEEQISRVVRARAGAFRACYESAVARDPKLQGGITVSFTVSPKGETTARIAKSSLANARVESCVLRMFNRLHFPSADKPTSANWPLVFRPGK